MHQEYRIKTLPKNTLFSRANLSRMYPSVPQELGLNRLEGVLKRKKSMQIATGNFIKLNLTLPRLNLDFKMIILCLMKKLNNIFEDLL